MQQYHAASNRRPCPEPATRFAEKDSLACALVLAGGEGKRLRPFIHLLRGDLLPKQYVNFIGRCSMLEHTLERAEKLEQLRALEAGLRIDVTIVDTVPRGVDTPADLETARLILAPRFRSS